MRGALAVLAAIAGLFSVADTLANAVVKADPDRAHALAPWDGVITGKLAAQRMLMEPSSAVDSDPARLARLALRQDATAVDGLTVLATQAQLRGQTEESRQIFAHSLRLSRRELQPRIWAIEEAVSRGDIDGALRHYDIALRTSRRAPEILFPVLASALAEPKVRSRLIALMASGSVWAESFVNFAAAQRADPEATASFLHAGEQAGLPIDDADRTLVADAHVIGGKAQAAWRYYASFRKHTKPDRSRDPTFSAKIERPALFDWVPRSSTGVSASIQSGRNDGLVDFSAAPSTGGVVLEQFQVLPKGVYRLESRVTGVEQPERSRPYWTLICEDGRELGRISLPNSIDGERRVTGRFTVPSGCSVQRLALVVRPSEEITGVYGRILSARLEPLSVGNGRKSKS